MDKRMREMKREMEAMGVSSVSFEPRKGTHFLIRGMKQGSPVRVLFSMSNWQKNPGIRKSVLTNIKRSMANGKRRG